MKIKLFESANDNLLEQLGANADQFDEIAQAFLEFYKKTDYQTKGETIAKFLESPEFAKFNLEDTPNNYFLMGLMFEFVHKKINDMEALHHVFHHLAENIGGIEIVEQKPAEKQADVSNKPKRVD